MRIRTIASFFIAMFLSQAANGELLTPPETSYSAKRTIEAAGMTMAGSVYYDRGKERWETTMQGMRQVSILLPEERKLLMYMPDMNMAMEMGAGDVADYGIGEIYNDGVEAEEVGTEVIESEKTTKFRVRQTDETTTVFVWLTSDGIPMKAEGTTSEGKFSMQLRELARGPQDPALFRLPAGVTPMAMPAGMPPPMMPR